MNEEENEELGLGPCCSCECTGPQVRNIIMVHKRAVVPGHGWGCVICNLPFDGASYVQCDDCFDLQREPVYACRGYPGKDGRIPITELTEPFDHFVGMKH